MDIISYQLENSTQFWDELHDIVSGDYHSTNKIDRAILAYLHLASLYMEQYLISDEDLTKCAYDLINSHLYSQSRAFVRRKLISMLVLSLEDLNINWRILIGAVLLVDGRLHKSTLEMLQEEAAISLIIETLWQNRFSNIRLQRIFLELLYEMCKIQKIPIRELQKINQEFFEFLFSIIENKIGFDKTDPYNMAAVKVILALNEQYMIAVLGGNESNDNDRREHSNGNRSNGSYGSYEYQESHESHHGSDHARSRSRPRSRNRHHSYPPADDSDSNDSPPTLYNKIFNILKYNGNLYRGFGESLAFIFNRGSDKCIQLMMLKLLYLIFTTKETYQYIYLNDLKVVVCVIIRELNDLSYEEEDLRNTYLRVLHPLLQNTQIRNEEYKKDDIISLLEVIANPSLNSSQIISENTQRIAYRCLKVDWLGYCSPIVSPVSSLSEQNTGTSIDRKQSSSVPLIEISPVSSISPSASDIDLPQLKHSMSYSNTQSDPHSHSHSHSHNQTRPKKPPRPTPRKLQAYQIRNTSAIEVATLQKSNTPPPPPPRHRTLHPSILNNLPENKTTHSHSPSPTPPPPPPRPRLNGLTHITSYP